MAQYKVPQDVEAEDKLIGPFSFRQFVYLLVAAGCIALTVGLFQLFPLLAIIPILPAFLFLILALPLKKDQPMETYLAAIVSYYLKPRTKHWMPGQRESTILITAPKIVEDTRTRDISEEEATHRLSFLADIVDTQGYAIKGATNSSMREDLVAEANATEDMFDAYDSMNLNKTIQDDATVRRQEAIREMRAAIKRSEDYYNVGVTLTEPEPEPDAEPKESVIVMPDVNMLKKAEEKPVEKPVEKPQPKPVNHSIMELANNNDFSVATIAKEANRINGKDEVFISLH
ncbi:PrgI family protein [Candidatus Saccharibacteria bacterium]|nr:PrgI family protein [Candidatus Saccharibacteria bacterium]